MDTGLLAAEVVAATRELHSAVLACSLLVPRASTSSTTLCSTVRRR